MGKEKKSKVSFQFTALQKRIKLLEAKVLLLTEDNRRLNAEVRANWRKEAMKDAAMMLSENIEVDMYGKYLPSIKGLSEQVGNPKKPWWKLF